MIVQKLIHVLQRQVSVVVLLHPSDHVIHEGLRHGIGLHPQLIQVTENISRREDIVIHVPLVAPNSSQELIHHAALLLEAEAREAIYNFADAHLCVRCHGTAILDCLQKVKLFVAIRVR